MTPCCVPIENGKWHVVRGACGQIFLPLSFILFYRLPAPFFKSNSRLKRDFVIPCLVYFIQTNL